MCTLPNMHSYNIQESMYVCMFVYVCVCQMEVHQLSMPVKWGELKHCRTISWNNESKMKSSPLDCVRCRIEPTKLFSYKTSSFKRQHTNIWEGKTKFLHFYAFALYVTCFHVCFLVCLLNLITYDCMALRWWQSLQEFARATMPRSRLSYFILCTSTNTVAQAMQLCTWKSACLLAACALDAHSVF